jgi:hypothetical protein
MKVSERIDNIINKMKSGGVLYMYYGVAKRKQWSLQDDGLCGLYEEGLPVSQDIINYMVSENLIQVEVGPMITRAILAESTVSV